MKPKRQENLVIARIMNFRGLGSGGVNYSSHFPIWKSANTTKGTFLIIQSVENNTYSNISSRKKA